MATSRVQSLPGRLVRAGFREVERAVTLLADPVLVSAIGQVEASSPFIAALAVTADPDLALLSTVRLIEAADADTRMELADLLTVDAERDPEAAQVRDRMLAVLGFSTALGAQLIAHPRLLQTIREADSIWAAQPQWRRAMMLEAVGADPDAPMPVAVGPAPESIDIMRREYRRQLLAIAAVDLGANDPLQVIDWTATVLADLATAALDASVAIARSGMPDHGASTKLAVIAMGKCGARELNYVSDVDVIYVVEPSPGSDDETANKIGTRLASATAAACSGPAQEPPLWQVDAALRPEGKQGPLVRTLASHIAYYERWASTWEFQAQLKARVAAGDQDLGQRYVEALRPMVWSAVERKNFVEDTRAMRRRVEELIPGNEADRQIKLGKGGLRDIEFTVQLIQLVHGRSDDAIRSPGTIDATTELVDGGYIGRDDGARLLHCYRQLRVIEHRLQLRRLTRTHLLPDDEDELRVISRGARLPRDELQVLWRQIRREVRDLHEDLYYRPILPETARLTAEEAVLAPAAGEARLAAIGYADPSGAMRHITALTDGVTRTARIQKQLLPVMLGWFAQGADADAGLLSFRRLSETLGGSPWYLKLLRDSTQTAERLASVLSTSRYASNALMLDPQAITWLASNEQLTPLTRARLDAEMGAVIGRAETAEHAGNRLRGIRRRELSRIALAEFLGLVTTEGAVGAISDVNDATLAAALMVAELRVRYTQGIEEPPTAVAVVAMGRQGGREAGYGSDADVMFVHRPMKGASDSAATEYATAVVTQFRKLLSDVGQEPPLPVDLDLRPEGRQGPVTRSFDSYVQYYSRWSDPWEAQALLRARVVAGPQELREDFTALIDQLRYPAGGIGVPGLREVRRLKARMEAERLPRGVDPARHLKLGRGGISDVEWTVQILQMQDGCQVKGLNTTSTLGALTAAMNADLITAKQAGELREAWILATRVRHAIVLFTGRDHGAQLDVLPTDRHVLAGVAQVLGYGQNNGDTLENDYLRVTRRARRVFDKVFYD